MATSNLSSLFTGIGNTIRSMGGGSAKIKAADFSTAISNIKRYPIEIQGVAGTAITATNYKTNGSTETVSGTIPSSGILTLVLHSEGSCVIVATKSGKETARRTIDIPSRVQMTTRLPIPVRINVAGLVAMTVRRDTHSAASIDNLYAAVAGGIPYGGGGTETAEAYNIDLTHYNLPNLCNRRQYPFGASVGKYGVFMSGRRIADDGGAWVSGDIDYYDSTLTHSNIGGRTHRNGMADFNSSYALQAGGSWNGVSGTVDVDALDGSLTFTRCTDLPSARREPIVVGTPNYIIVVGGWYDNEFSDGVAYDNNLTQKTIPNLSTGTWSHYSSNGLGVGAYSLIPLGESLENMDYYSGSLTRSTMKYPHPVRDYVRNCRKGDFGFFIGGRNGTSTYTDQVTAIDTNLVCTTTTPLSSARCTSASTTVGNYMLSTGGYRANPDYEQDTVDVYL